MSLSANQELQMFANQHKLEGLTSFSLAQIFKGQSGYSVEKAGRFLKFQDRINNELLTHRVITNNEFTSWFSEAELTFEMVKQFIIQFSVFSNQFLIAQLLKTINADSLEGMRASKEILANEIGVVFKRFEKVNGSVDQDVDPELVSTEGSVEGGTFRFRAAHFEWLLRISNRLGLSFNDVGKRKHGIETTLFFCDELARLYGNELSDFTVSKLCS